MTDLISYGENVAAIAAAIHGEHYDALYEKCSEQVGGFVGIWNICATAAKVFTDEEAPYTAGEDYCWIEAIDDYASHICSCLQSGDIPCVSAFHKLAASSIEKSWI